MCDTFRFDYITTRPTCRENHFEIDFIAEENLHSNNNKS